MKRTIVWLVVSCLIVGALVLTSCSSSVSSAEAHNNRGLAYSNLFQFKRAIENYSEAIRLNPQYAEAYINRGFAYDMQGKKAEALADFEECITLTDDPQLIEMARQQIEELSK